MILAFEQLEAARWLSYLKPGGQVIVNVQRIEPMPVITGAKAYPDELVEKMKAAGAQVLARDFLALAEEAGSPRAVNVAMIGCLAGLLTEIPAQAWTEAMDILVPAKFLELNKKAFALGGQA